MEVSKNPDRIPVNSIIVNDALSARPQRSPDFQLENEALRSLAHKLGQSPYAAMQELVDQALQLCRANSAGISIAEKSGDQDIFRWHAVAGRLAPFLNGTMPRFFSPCGEVLDRRAVILMRDIALHYEYVAGLKVPMHEVLLVPFFRGNEPVGTIWVVKHDAPGHFDREDQRLLESLASVTSGIAASYLNVKKLEASVAELNNERDQRERFVAALTHDLRTPLTATRLSAQLLLKKLEGAGERIKLETIVKGMDRAERMIRDLLDASRVQSGEGLPLYPAHCRLDKIVAAAVKDLSVLHGARFHVANTLGEIEIYCDEDGIQRIIENLCSNAAKYGAAETPITITLEKAAGRAEISVHNEGNPIEVSELASIFKPYRRTGAAEAAGQKGWGIGLALVKGITEAHGGTVTVLSESGGTTFRVSLPLKKT
jgi:signal transduction histidine kinase